MNFRTLFTSLCLSALTLSLFGCASTSKVAPVSNSAVHGSGRVMGGQQPVKGSTIQLYTVGTTANGSASTALLTTTVTTSDGTGQANSNANSGNANNTLPAGDFLITSDYTCADPNELVFITASGGDPGNGSSNAALEMVSALGTCTYLQNQVSQINIDEIATVGTVAALHNFMTGYNAIGAAPGNTAALQAAFTTATEYYDLSAGSTPGPALPSGYYGSSTELNTLADITSICINAAGPNDTGCAQFFNAARPTNGNVPADTVTALLDISNNPTNNVTNLYNLTPAQAPFQPSLSAAPVDWSLPILPQPDTPSISPNGGTFTSAQNVTISDSDSSAVIYYTTDGSQPSTSSTRYTGAVTVSTNETINAIAIESGRLTSAVASATFEVTVSTVTPTVSLASISSPYGSTAPITLTASSNANGSVVTFGTVSPVTGTFSPTTCTIASGACSVSYFPTGTLAGAAYPNDLTASFSAVTGFASATATSTLTISQGVTETSLYSFDGNSAGEGEGNLIQGLDGNYYGVTEYGGSNSDGVIFRITPSGAFTVLHSFTGADGTLPTDGLILASDGNFYGTAQRGGANGGGTIFKMTSSGAFTLLYSFTGGNDGGGPQSRLTQGVDGNFYGSTTQGGPGSGGTLFKMTPDGTVTSLHVFSTSSGDAYWPLGPLVQGTDGKLYGSAERGPSGYGAVFSIQPDGTYATIHAFTAADGGITSLAGGITMGADGNLYGVDAQGHYFRVTPAGAATVLNSLPNPRITPNFSAPNLASDGNFYVNSAYGGTGYGALYQLTPAGGVNELFAFGSPDTGVISDPAYPPLQGADGSFYGVSDSGGTAEFGGVYKVTVQPGLTAPVALSVPSSVSPGATFSLGYSVPNAVSATMQYCFATNTAGDTTWSGVLTGSTQAKSVTLTASSTPGDYTYTLTCGGVETGFATVNVAGSVAASPAFSPSSGSFNAVQSVSITTASTGASIYYTTDGSTPTSASPRYTGPVTVSSSETVQAIAFGGGYSASPVSAAVYTVTLAAPTVSLSSASIVAGSPDSVTVTAASNAEGSVVTVGVLSPARATVTPQSCTISAGSCTVQLSSSATSQPGTYPGALIASFSPAGAYAAASATNTLTITPGFNFNLLFNFTNTTGAYMGDLPYTGLAQGADGYLYGTTISPNGNVFRTSTTGAYTVLHTFANSTTDARRPQIGVIRGADGNFYGAATSGGANGYGAIYRMDAAGNETLVHSFTGATDGYSTGTLLQGSDGYLYGINSAGGTNSTGTIYKMSLDGSTFTVLHVFAATAEGTSFAALLEGADGNFYGTRSSNGPVSGTYAGTFFKMTPAGVFTVVHTFLGGAGDGAIPEHSIIQDADGNFYGATENGGPDGYGTVYRMTPTGTITILHSLVVNGYRYNGTGGLFLATDGNLYGTSQSGESDYGAVYRVTPSGSFTVIHSFLDDPADGQVPYATVVQAADGNLYGTTYGYGNESPFGSVYALSYTGTLPAPVSLSVPASVPATGSFTINFTALNAYSKTMQACTALNNAGMTDWTGLKTATPTGNTATLTAPATPGTYTYSLTCGGVEANSVTLNVTTPPAASVPAISPASGSYTAVQSVTITPTVAGQSIYYTVDGSTPTTASTRYTGPVTVSSSETINAIAAGGGYGPSPVASAAYTLTLATPAVSVSAVAATYGATTPVSVTATSNVPGSVVTFGTSGTLGGSFSPATCTIASGSCSVNYIPSGTTAGGTYVNGVTASFTASGAYGSASAYNKLIIGETNSTYAFTLLHSYAGGSSDGAGQSSIVQGPDGNFYGVTQSGGTANDGTLFKLVPNGTSSTLTVLHSFTGSDGATPLSNITFGNDGNLYGVTVAGGASNAGTLFEYALSTSTFTSLYAFTGNSDGFGPTGGLLQATDGYLYGATQGAGDNGSGTLFRFLPGTASPTVTVVHAFAGGSSDGDTPFSSRLVQASNGTIYGTTQNGGSSYGGTIFSYTPSSGTYSIAYSFNGGSDGQDPLPGLVQGADGLLYGATTDGGNTSNGTAYSLDPATNTFTLLHSFSGTEPSGVESAFAVATDGNLYGVSNSGGSGGKGTVFQLVPNGTSSTVKALESLTTATGASAIGNILQGADGNFYTTASRNAAHSNGGIFELAPAPSLSAPIQLNVLSQVTAGQAFTLSYSVANAFSQTMQSCFVSNATAGTVLAQVTASTTVQGVGLIAPSTAGTYSFALTCGGQQSGFITVTVQPALTPGGRPAQGLATRLDLDNAR